MNELIDKNNKESPLLFLGGEIPPLRDRGWLTRAEKSQKDSAVGNKSQQIEIETTQIGNISQQSEKTNTENHNNSQQSRCGETAIPESPHYQPFNNKTLIFIIQQQSMKQTIILLAAILFSTWAGAQASKVGKDGFTLLPGGISYKMIQDATGGVSPKNKDYVETHMYVIVDGKMIYNSRNVNEGKPVSFLMQQPTSKTDLQEVIKLMTPGDSVAVMMSVDSMIKSGVAKLDWMKPNTGQYATYLVKMLSVRELTDKKAPPAGK